MSVHESTLNWDDWTVYITCTCGWTSAWGDAVPVPQITAVWDAHVQQESGCPRCGNWVCGGDRVRCVAEMAASDA